MSQIPELLTVLVHLVATGSAMLLLRRRPTRRLRLLILAVGIMSVSQIASVLHAGSGMEGLAAFHQTLVGVMAIYALYLLRNETGDRNLTDFRIRLAEHERANPKPLSLNVEERWSRIVKGSEAQPAKELKRKPPANTTTEDLVALSFALGPSVNPVNAPARPRA